ncbi:aminoglycoside phosphotransferase family protein [Micromonospora zamorensis]|uniref:phosphotransferase family protein n=1 Tax=Micromonospora zamorensis TaxID=709883 RepID=UPI0033E68C58
MHAVPVADEVRRLLPAGGAAYPSIVAGTRAVAERLRDPDPDDLAGPLAAELAGVWSGVADRVVTLTRGVERLAVDQRVRPGPDVVCHGDPHLGNLLLGPDGQVWLVDWDDAVLAPPECDLMFVLGGVLAFAPVSAGQQKAALAGYGAADIDPARLAWFRCATSTGGVDRKPRPSATGNNKGKELVRSLPPPTYTAPGALRQDPGCAAESPP